MSSPLKTRFSLLIKKLINKDAEACRDMAEEFFRQKNIHFALCAIEAARLKNPNLPGLESYFSAYMVNKLAVEEESLYKILCIEDHRSAGIDEIKKNYDALWLLFRPDRCSSFAAESATKHINKAWEVLSDARRREAYDILMGYDCEDDQYKKKTSENQFSLQRLRNPNHASSSSSSSSASSPSSCLHRTHKVLMVTKKGQRNGKKFFIVRRKTPFKIVGEVQHTNFECLPEEPHK